ncbi:hypothetical protein MBLNU230_g6077t1 [Neophaeotheca triangularis]
MKFSASLLALVAFTAVQAAAVADAEPRRGGRMGFCGAPGASCAKAKRAAEAVAEAVAEPRKHKSKMGFCGAKGASCARALENIYEIEAAAEHSHDLATRSADPEAWFRGKKNRRLKGGFCGARGASCAKRREAEPKKHKSKMGFCGAKGASCAKAKRDAVAEAEADPKKHKSKMGFCGAKGASCARAVEAINEVDPEILREECFEEGNECDTILKAHAAYHEAVKREADPTADPEAWFRGKKNRRLKGGFCGAKGASCARDTDEAEEAECFAEDGDCTVAEEGHADLGAALDRALETLETV